ncbi:MAG TPA: amidohydrolase family protein [Tepidisphaeraceae bacterium]|jgi:hypothetical protein
MGDIFAHHCHVFPESVNSGGTIPRLLELLDACNIAKAVAFAPFAQQVGGEMNPNRWLASELKSQPRLVGFGTINFATENLREQVQEIRALGLRGIKLHPNTQKFDILSPQAVEVYAAAQDENLFISFHTGVHHYRIKHYNVLGFDEIAHQFPDLRFSLEHVGGYHFFTEALAVIFNNIPFPPVPHHRPRVLGGLVSNFSRQKLPFWYLRPEQIVEAIEQVGAELMIFGIDFPYNREEDTTFALQTINALPIAEEQKRLILGGNLQRELRMD